MNWVRIYLTDDEMATLDDGQDWYEAGDSTILAGYLPDDHCPNPAFSLTVNDVEVCQNWDHWGDMPEWLQARLLTAGQKEE